MKTRLVCVERCWQRSPFRPPPKEVRPGRLRYRGQVGNTNPTAVRRRRTHDRQDHRRLFRMVNDQGASTAAR